MLYIPIFWAKFFSFSYFFNLSSLLVITSFVALWLFAFSYRSLMLFTNISYIVKKSSFWDFEQRYRNTSFACHRLEAISSETCFLRYAEQRVSWHRANAVTEIFGNRVIAEQAHWGWKARERIALHRFYCHRTYLPQLLESHLMSLSKFSSNILPKRTSESGIILIIKKNYCVNSFKNIPSIYISYKFFFFKKRINQFSAPWR